MSYIYNPDQEVKSIQSLEETGVIHNFLVKQQQQVRRLGLVLSSSLSSATDVQVDYKVRSTFNDAASESLIGSIIIPAGTYAQGSCFYNDATLGLQPVVAKEGDELLIEVSAAASSAGSGQGYMVSDEDPETNENNSNLIASS